MRTARIGRLEVSVIGLGCNNFGRPLDREESARVVRAALELGVTYFDTARVYGNGLAESFLGAALGRHRHEVVIATKFGRVPGMPESGGATGADVRRAIDKSLYELRTDYVDLYQLHFPDPETPIAATLGAMRELVEEGKVREIGCSNFDATQLDEALEVSADQGWPAFVSDQVQYSMVHRDPEVNGLADTCGEKGVALLPYYPLASGLLTGKTRRGQEPKGRLRMERYSSFLSEENFDLAERVEAFATEQGLTMAQVALGWLLTRPAVPSVTPGATRPEQLASNVEASEWRPSPADLAALQSVMGQAPDG